MSQEEKKLSQIEQVIIPQNLNLSRKSSTEDLTKEFGEWVTTLPQDFRQSSRLVIDVQGKRILHDLVKETIEIREPSVRFSVEPLNS